MRDEIKRRDLHLTTKRSCVIPTNIIGKFPNDYNKNEWNWKRFTYIQIEYVEILDLGVVDSG
jgi:hypothetical protein